jgi:hypothetical protein
MTPAFRRLLLVLAALVLIASAVFLLRPPSARVGSGAAAPGGGAAQAWREGNPVGDVKLESLDRRDESNAAPSRNVFRFEGRRSEAAPTPSRSSTARQPVEPVVEVPAGPPPPPPIPLRFIGYLEQAGAMSRVAVLSDGRGNVFNGKEGDVIEGRYRVLRIGNDSADLIYVDGRGRQTIRLSGQ